MKALIAVDGVFRNGKVELVAVPGEVIDEAPVIVTFLTATIPQPENTLEPPAFLVGQQSLVFQATAASQEAGRFAEGWRGPEMDGYQEAGTTLLMW